MDGTASHERATPLFGSNRWMCLASAMILSGEPALGFDAAETRQTISASPIRLTTSVSAPRGSESSTLRSIGTSPSRPCSVQSIGEVLGANADDDFLTGLRIVPIADRQSYPRRAGRNCEQLAVFQQEPSGQEVHLRRADEPGDKAIGGRGIELLRRAHLLDDAAAKGDDAVGQRHRLGLVVGDIDAGRPEIHVQSLDLRAHLDAQLSIEIGERLVKEEEPGLARDRATDRHALTLSARKLLRLAIEQSLDLQDRGRALDGGFDRGSRCSSHLQPEAKVLAHRHVRIESIVLEHHRDVPLARRRVVHDFAVNENLAAGDRFQACDHSENRALAAA